jgi:hypothetical protein
MLGCATTIGIAHTKAPRYLTHGADQKMEALPVWSTLAQHAMPTVPVSGPRQGTAGPPETAASDSSP